MNVFFKIILFVFIFVGAKDVQSQTPVTVDPDTPAPPSPIQLRIPHSERTRDNIMDSLVDFALVRFFKIFKNTEITYDFFEIDRNYDLNFTNFTVKVQLPNVQGNVVFSKMKINFDEFFPFLKQKKFIFSKVELTGVSVNMTISEKKEEKKQNRQLNYSAQNMILKKVHVTFEKDKQHRSKDITLASVVVDDAFLTLTNPNEKYAVSHAEMDNIVLPHKVIKDFTFSKVEADGKVFTDRMGFLQAIKQ